MTPDPERNADGTAPRPVAPRSKRAHRRPWDKDAPACGSSRLRTTAIALAWIPLPGLVLSYVFC